MRPLMRSFIYSVSRKHRAPRCRRSGLHCPFLNLPSLGTPREPVDDWEDMKGMISVDYSIAAAPIHEFQL